MKAVSSIFDFLFLVEIVRINLVRSRFEQSTECGQRVEEGHREESLGVAPGQRPFVEGLAKTRLTRCWEGGTW